MFVGVYSGWMSKTGGVRLDGWAILVRGRLGEGLMDWTLRKLGGKMM